MLKRYLIFTYITLSLSSLLFAQNKGEKLFDNSYVHEIRITFYEPNFWDSLESHYEKIWESGEKNYLRAQIKIDGQEIDTVGVREKGFNSNQGGDSRNPDYAKYAKKPFKIDVNEFIENQTFDGLKKFNLNNCIHDRSYMRDLLAYDILRKAGVKAPRTSYAKLYLNDIPWGLYLIVEQVDKTFLKSRLGNKNGNLYKANWTDLDWKGNDYKEYKDDMVKKTNKSKNDWSDFIRFVGIVNNIPDDQIKDSLNAVLNVENYLNTLAVDVAINNWDSYFDHGRNFYIYFDENINKFQWIPWDYDLSFESSFNTEIFPKGFGGGNSDSNDNNEAYFKILIKRIKETEVFRNSYLDKFNTMLSDNFTVERINELIDQTSNLIRESAKADTNWSFTFKDFEKSISDQGPEPDNSSPEFGGSAGLKYFIKNRVDSLKQKLSALLITSVAANNNITPSNVELMQNYPNPFNPTTKIKFTIPASGISSQSKTTLIVYGILGNEIKTLVNEYKPAGEYEIKFNAEDLSSGMYIYKLTTGDHTSVKRMILLK